MEKEKQLNELNLRNIIGAVFRQKLFIFIIVPLSVTAAFFVLLFQTPVYEASVKMHVVGKGQVTADTYYDIGPGGLHQTQMEIVKSNPVIKRAVLALKLHQRSFDYEGQFCHPLKKYLIDFMARKELSGISDLTPEDQREVYFARAMNILKDGITTALIPGTDIFIINVRDFNPWEAISMANVISRSYVIFDLQQQFAELTQRYGIQHPSVQQLKDNIYGMIENLSGKELPELEAIGTASVKIIEQATSQFTPVGKSKKIILIISIVVSLGFSTMIALVYDMYVDQTFKSPTEVIKFTGLPLLGSTPIRKINEYALLNNDAFNLSKSEILYTDFLEDLADQLYINMKINRQKTILITSAFPKGGATTICANLALSLSQNMNLKTLIVDANFRKPAINKLFNIDEGPGLANLLEEGRLIEYHARFSDNESFQNQEPVIVTEKTNYPSRLRYRKELFTQINEIINHIDPRLDILQAGKASMTPISLLDSSKIDSIFKITKVSYDVVIIDCTNLKEFKDAGILSSHVDGVVLVVNDGKERRQIVMNSILYIKQKKGNPVGVILNRRRFPIPNIIYRWI